MGDMKKIVKICKQHYGIFLMAIFFLMVHIFASPTYWDDLSFRNMVHQKDFSLVGTSISRYLGWSSRTVIELVLFIVASLPTFVWNVLDFFVVILLYFDFVWLLNLKGSQEKNFFALLFLAFPFSILASTGWMATTMNYLWVFAFGFYVLVGLERELGIIPQVKRRHLHLILYILCLIYSANFEFMGCILFLFFVVAGVYCYNKQIKSGFVITGSIMSLASIVYIIACPGIRLRPAVDIDMWSPDFKKMTIIDKLRIGFVGTFSHFASVPSALFLLFLVIVMVCGLSFGTKSMLSKSFTKNEFKRIRILAFIPVIFYLASIFYFAIAYILPRKMLTYVIPSDLINSKSDFIEQIVLLLAFLLIAVSTVSVIYKAHGIRFCSMMLVILAMGFGPCIAMGFTAELRSSLLRVMSFAYMALILIIMELVILEKDYLKKNKVIAKIVYLIAIGGDLMNMLQVIRHISIYG